MEQSKINKKLFVRPYNLHISICSLALTTPEKLEKAKMVMKSIQGEIEEIIKKEGQKITLPIAAIE